MISINRNKKTSIVSEGQISITQNDSDSITTLKLSQQKNYQKQKEKNQLVLNEAVLRQLLHADRFISSEKSYFKFPQFDFFLNIDCLFSSVNSNGPVEGSIISVINQFKKIKYTKISKKSNGVHIYFQKKDCFQLPWKCLVDRMQSFGSQDTYEMSNYLADACQKEYIPREDTESLNDQSYDQHSAQKIFNEGSQRDDIDKIDDLFIQNKNKPMIIWRGVLKEMYSVHINECYLNFLQYTPEEFQLEVALSGLPEFLTSHNYYQWVKQLLNVVNNVLSISRVENEERQCYTFQKEHITQNGQHLTLELESYDLIIGGCNLVVEVGVNEIKQTKKKNKKKQEQANQANNNEIKEEQQQQPKCNTLVNLNEAKRKLTDEEKYFINNHYFKIQDFDFNKSKVCKYRMLSSDFSTKIQLQFHA
ncbi:hypothetical protein TTHERM_00755870 (macronuclear) [Tetrahymena thermophila SB210]|uniref:Uncharacterized protein n=1 Tax=Tetrahymena thermophila (strain SB210) TaxID=312017 RepID=I7MFM8_TETTS|nr:hypothetical protein TTHERM_00755870 [Tetrahymena thermophila SB210]EAR84053.2 hypothetical protein TTHERM_00755870 [Tetrahymena thermophila SB210]|eukprot:XP_001031716.2 hypothetical protein TTHERM_00755870 [Tetrahymena thermophila SB210]